MEKLTLKGIVKQVGKTQVISDKFSKRELILKTEYESKYPQYIVVQFTKAKVTLLDNIFAGEIVSVNINLKGKEYEKDGATRYFNTIEGWAIKKDDPEVPSNPVATDFSSEDSQDLPF